MTLYCRVELTTHLPDIHPPLHPGPLVDCTIKLNSFRSKFAVHFTHFRFSDCRSSVAMKEEGTDGYKRYLRGMPSSFCRLPVNKVLGKIYVTEWTTLSVEVTGDYFGHGDGFSLVYNLFTDEPCDNDQHACNNGRCINNALKCSGYNPCEDGSDCPEGPDKLSAGEIVGIVIGVACVAGLILLLCVVPKLACCKAKHPRAGETPNIQIEQTVSPSAINLNQPRPSSTGRVRHNPILTPRGPVTEIAHIPNARRLAAEQWTSEHPSEPPDYSIVDYVSTPTRRTHTPEASAPSEEVIEDEHIDVSSVYGGEQAPLNDGARDNVETAVSGYTAPPPSYDVVVNYQDLYNVSGSTENVESL